MPSAITSAACMVIERLFGDTAYYLQRLAEAVD